MSWLSRLVERRILKAKAEGKLDDLAGEGEPLKAHPEDAHVDAGLAAGYRIMAEARALPPEITRRKEIDAIKARYATLTDQTEKAAAMAELAELEMRHNIAVETRRRFHSG